MFFYRASVNVAIFTHRTYPIELQVDSRIIDSFYQNDICYLVPVFLKQSPGLTFVVFGFVFFGRLVVGEQVEFIELLIWKTSHKGKIFCILKSFKILIFIN